MPGILLDLMVHEGVQQKNVTQLLLSRSEEYSVYLVSVMMGFDTIWSWVLSGLPVKLCK